MTVSVTVQQRTWDAPSPRKTWVEVAALVRAALGAYSSVILTDEQVNEALARAVESSFPKYHHRELWQVELEGYVDSIVLPWSPTAVVYVGWKDGSDNTSPSYIPQQRYGRMVPSSLWEVEFNQWRWLGTVNEFPLGNSIISWAMLAEGKPLTMADEPNYCTVPNQYIVPLACAELLLTLGNDSGINRVSALQLIMAMKQQALLALPAERPEQRQMRYRQDTVTTVIFKAWGQTNITFADLA